jgi:hypothetical protein
MHTKTILALGGGTLAVALAVASPVAFAAGGSRVSVRVEGKTRTLLATKTVRTRAGSITRGGAPAGKCPATSAAGALDVATSHRWKGPWSSDFSEFEITTILGETESTTKFYWGIWIDNRYATTGACGIKLHPGERLLFAVDSVAHHEHPLAIRAPSHAAAGKPFAVKVVWFSDGGASKPLAGAHVSAGSAGVVTNSHGVAQVVAGKAGSLALGAASNGFIRAAQVRVRVSG